MLKLGSKTVERLMVTGPMISTTVVKRSALRPARRKLQIIIPHRLNWALTSATVRAFQRLHAAISASRWW